MTTNQTLESIDRERISFGEMPADVVMDADLQAHIGRQLRNVYDGQRSSERLPESFLRLLRALDEKR
ncbi:MAG TPA: NepR family anti-sigma factor [Acetobacteraceae bacterium]|jgi:hypothetical protein